MKPKTLALIGVGLIGGSAALAWRHAGAVGEAVGFDPNPDALRRAQALGVIDRAAASAAEAVRGADLVLLAPPVLAMPEAFEAVAAALRADALVTDVGSTKFSVIAAARGALSRAAFARYVPGHPIAGRELPGVEHAQANLFQGKYCILTPLVAAAGIASDTATDAAAVAAVDALWRLAGARVARMDAAEHDRVFAAVSHLPHLLAFALVARIASETDGERKLAFAGAGFRDFTRIAASSPIMWRDISLANQAALSEELRGYRALLDELQDAVDRGDGAAIESVYELASRARRRHAATFDSE
jgi:prephenate dehydrogenase